MPNEMTEMEKRHMMRLPNADANKLTIECIQTALIHLMADKDFDRISVSEIVKKAGVSRTAFYNNYSSKEDVLYTLSSRLLDDLNNLTLDALSNDQRKATYP